MSFKNKVVLITGGSSGIGASTAELFAKEGAAVTIVGRNEANLKKVSVLCEKLGAKTLTIQADLTKDEDIKTIVSKTIDKFGKLDVLVNNAGILTFGSIVDGNVMEHFDKTIKTNLRAAVYITSLAAPYLIQSKGNIINISSVLGVSFLGNPKYLPYSISKAALDHFTRGAALELWSAGVRVNTVSPGPTKTDIFARAGLQRTWEETSKVFKVPKVLEAEEIGDLIVYLASDKAKSITGVNYYIDNGTLLNK